MDGIIIRPTLKEDCAKLIDFLQRESCNRRNGNIDLSGETLYNFFDQNENFIVDFIKNGFEEISFQSLIAEDQNSIVGCVIWSIGYGTWQARKMFIEEFCLSKKFKETQFEELFFTRLSQEALKLDCAEIKTCTKNNSHLGELFIKMGGINASNIENWHLYCIKLKK